MKKELLITFSAFFFMSLTALTGVYAGESQEKTVTISEEKVDVTGDGKKDLIYVKGVPYEEGAQFLKKIFLKIRASNGENYKIDLEAGYDPTNIYKDLNHDSVKDIFISVPTGGSGGLSNFYLYSLKDFQVTNLTVPEPLAASSQFEDGYKASIKLQETGQSYTFDLSDRKEEYESLGLYQDGKLNEPTELMVLPFGILKPIKVKDDFYGLKGIQRINGAYNADGIANIESTWLYEKGKWRVINAEVKSLQSE
ncbi:hypothetical protein G3A_05000 [Bacillus sp. 17376]|uniref:Uncharacterized protein n=1 Tax=Mesobacillus boroniphilus JCM 21738 TaxID=1294265 RepID=W4RPV7_9BACI|nr:hypothetical protein [Mesobacillus boroniphilus]ESU33561.1 hypothetical protein G3A_05000 [Bacillus sp. 17376]GAE46157.1 hypothetical protein JCM21738_3026 [Mesobacillus boroniphilus JCM 21738]